ncbi:MAG: tetratricopeptide repeat protein [Planctomycetes bacterium]|nr:tetratricopeptide repeat protein [Planctomycetota bacterium]
MPSSAEQLYEFRHAMVREAAYQMQLPSERAALHDATFEYLHATLDDADRTVHAQELLSHIRGAGDEALATYELVYLRRAARRAQYTFQDAAACDLLEEVRSHHLCDLETSLRASQELGGLLLRLGRPEDAVTVLRDALNRAHREAPKQVGQLLAALAGVYMESGQAVRAKELFEQAVAKLREAGDERQLGIALTNRAILLRHLGDAVDVEALLNEALDVHRRTGNLRFEALTLMALGGSRRALDDDASAERCYAEALRVFRDTGDRPHEAQALGNLANVFLMTERLDAAQDAYLRALRVMRELGHRRSEAILLGNIGQLLQRTGRLGASLRAGHDSVAMLEQLNDLMLLPAFRAMHAGTLAAVGEFEQAETQLARAETELGNAESVSALDHTLPEIIRFRLAQAAGGYGPGRNPKATEPARIEQASGVLKRLRDAGKSRDDGRTKILDRSSLELARLLADVRGQLETGQPPLLFNNLALTKTAPEFRKALLCRLEALEPGQVAYMREHNPELYRLLIRDLKDVPEPDWRSEELPAIP